MPPSISTHRETCPCPACRRRRGLVGEDIHLRLSPALLERARKLASAKGITLTALISDALQTFLLGE